MEPQKDVTTGDSSDGFLDKVIQQVIAERLKQDKKWGVQDHAPIDWIRILTEDVDEASRDATDHHFENQVKWTCNGLTSYQPCDRVIQNARLEAYRKKMIQVAAVAIQAIESIDRNYFANKRPARRVIEPTSHVAEPTRNIAEPTGRKRPAH